MGRHYEVTIREVVERTCIIPAAHRSEAKRIALSEPDDPRRAAISDMSDMSVLRVTVTRVAISKDPHHDQG